MTPIETAEPKVPLRHMIAFGAMVIGMFMAILDIQIVSASLAEIQAGLSASADEITWVQTAYLIAEVVMIPLSGILSRIFSTRYLFSFSAAGFTLMSLMCAASSSISEMILWRALQGFIGGAMIPTVFAVAFTVFPPKRRPMVSSIMGLVATMAPTIGPTAGGYLTELFSWHWLFLINVVPGIMVAVATFLLIDFDKPNLSLIRDFDWFGLLGLALFLCNLEYVLEEGPAKDWFQDETVAICAILSVIGAVLFFYRTLTVKQPVVDLRGFLSPSFSMGCFVGFVLGIGLYGLTYVYPVYLARVRGNSALQIGETLFISGLVMFICAPLVGRLMQRVDLRVLVGFGLVVFSLGAFLASSLTKDWVFGNLLLPLVMRGVGLMFIMPPISNLALSSLSPERLKGSSGLFNLSRNLGGAFGLAAINSLLNKRMDHHLARLHEQVSWGSTMAEETLANLTLKFADLGPDASLAATKQLSAIVRREALVMALSDVFIALAVVFALMLLIVPLIRGGSLKGGNPPPDAH